MNDQSRRIASAASASASISSASSAEPGGSASRPTMTISGTAIGVTRVATTWTICRRGALDQPGKAAEFGHPGAGVFPRGLHQQMLGLIFAQHVVDEVGREADLAAGLALARVLALDQPADHRDLAKSALEQLRLFDPLDEFLFEDVGRQQGRGVGDRFQAVDGDGIIVGDEAHAA